MIRKLQGLGQRKVYCKAMWGEQVIHDPKPPEVPEKFQETFLGKGIPEYVIISCTILSLIDDY